MKLPRLCALSAATCVLLAAVSSPEAQAAASPQLEIRQTEPARFPAGLIAQGITSGEAWVVVSIDEQGRLADALVSRYTHRALADEAMRVLKRSEFTPVLQNGQPVAVCTDVHFSFEATGCIISLDPLTTLQRLTASAHQPNYHKHVYGADEIDRPLVPTHQVSPFHPGNLRAEANAGGQALIEFIIDETGRTRMPVLLSAAHPEYANVAADAVREWQFTPPTRDGKPVAVRVRQEFIFPDS